MGYTIPAYFHFKIFHTQLSECQKFNRIYAITGGLCRVEMTRQHIKYTVLIWSMIYCKTECFKIHILPQTRTQIISRLSNSLK